MQSTAKTQHGRRPYNIHEVYVHNRTAACAQRLYFRSNGKKLWKQRLPTERDRARGRENLPKSKTKTKIELKLAANSNSGSNNEKLSKITARFMEGENYTHSHTPSSSTGDGLMYNYWNTRRNDENESQNKESVCRLFDDGTMFLIIYAQVLYFLISDDFWILNIRVCVPQSKEPPTFDSNPKWEH